MADSVNELFKKYRETRDVSLRNAIAEKHLYIAEILAKMQKAEKKKKTE